jgi:hypothetical protein
MKKLFVVFLFFVSANIATAQRFNAGVIAGLATTQVYGDDLYGFYKFGPFLGAMVNAPLGNSNTFSVQMELDYIQKGSRTNTEKDSNYFYQMTLNYIEVPIVFQYHHPSKLVLEAGPSVGFLLSSSEENNDGLLPEIYPYKNIEYGICAGMMYPLYKNLQMNVRWSNSIVPIRENVVGVHGTYWRGQYNVLINFTLRYYFNSTANHQ